MEYRIKAHSTIYNGVRFRSRLEARWAAFFDIQDWNWKYEPVDLVGWTPDFWLSIPCGHSECNGNHELYIEVKPYEKIEQFKGHAIRNFDEWGLPSPAQFGMDPSVAAWTMVHGDGGGDYNLEIWLSSDWREAWLEAGNLVQYRA